MRKIDFDNIGLLSSRIGVGSPQIPFQKLQTFEKISPCCTLESLQIVSWCDIHSCGPSRTRPAGRSNQLPTPYVWVCWSVYEARGNNLESL